MDTRTPFYVFALCFGIVLRVHALTVPPVNITERVLQNGLTVHVLPDHRAPVVSVHVGYVIGGSYEPRGQTGVSHALEHMMFRGTPTVPKDGFTKMVSELGGALNAFTSSDATVYHEVVPKASLELVLKLEADRMRHLLLDPAVFSKEMEVVKEERRMRIDDDPTGLMFEQLNAISFAGGDYQNPVIGWPEDLDNMTAESLRAWYNAYYAPNNAYLVVGGDVEPNEVFALAEKYFEGLPANHSIEKTLKKAALPTPTLGERKIALSAAVGAVQMAMIAIPAPSIMTATESYEPYALELLTAILSQGNSGRLIQPLIRTQKVASSIGVYYDYFSRGNSRVLVHMVAQGDTEPEAMVAAFWNEITRLQDEGISEDELKKVQNMLLTRALYERDDLSSQVLDVVWPQMYQKPPTFVNDIIAARAAVTLEQVQAVAKKYMKRSTSTFATFVPKRALPQQEKEAENVDQSAT